MRLSDKILYCRKKSGLSQEQLAEKLEVSRQSVSKWETGEALPEITKLRLLSSQFNVTADWLLDESEPQPEIAVKAITDKPKNDSGKAKSIFKRYIWLSGIVVSFIGASLAGIGFLIRYMFSGMISSAQSDIIGSFERGYFGILIPDGVESIYNDVSALVSRNPVLIIGNVLSVVGIIIVIIGLVLAVMLKLRSSKKSLQAE